MGDLGSAAEEVGLAQRLTPGGFSGPNFSADTSPEAANQAYLTQQKIQEGAQNMSLAARQQQIKDAIEQRQEQMAPLLYAQQNTQNQLQDIALKHQTKTWNDIGSSVAGLQQLNSQIEGYDPTSPSYVADITGLVNQGKVQNYTNAAYQQGSDQLLAGHLDQVSKLQKTLKFQQDQQDQAQVQEGLSTGLLNKNEFAFNPNTPPQEIYSTMATEFRQKKNTAQWTALGLDPNAISFDGRGDLTPQSQIQLQARQAIVQAKVQSAAEQYTKGPLSPEAQAKIAEDAARSGNPVSVDDNGKVTITPRITAGTLNDPEAKMALDTINRLSTRENQEGSLTPQEQDLLHSAEDTLARKQGGVAAPPNPYAKYPAPTQAALKNIDSQIGTIRAAQAQNGDPTNPSSSWFAGQQGDDGKAVDRATKLTNLTNQKNRLDPQGLGQRSAVQPTPQQGPTSSQGAAPIPIAQVNQIYSQPGQIPVYDPKSGQLYTLDQKDMPAAQAKGFQVIGKDGKIQGAAPTPPTNPQAAATGKPTGDIGVDPNNPGPLATVGGPGPVDPADQALAKIQGKLQDAQQQKQEDDAAAAKQAQIEDAQAQVPRFQAMAKSAQDRVKYLKNQIDEYSQKADNTDEPGQLQQYASAISTLKQQRDAVSGVLQQHQANIDKYSKIANQEPASQYDKLAAQNGDTVTGGGGGGGGFDKTGNFRNGAFKELLAGKEQAIISAAEKYGLDPKLFGAIVAVETAHGAAKNDKGQPSVLARYNNPGGLMDGKTKANTGFQKFPDIETGLNAMARLIKTNYIDKGLTTPSQIGKKYSPPGAANDPRNTNSNWVPLVSKIMKTL